MLALGSENMRATEEILSAKELVLLILNPLNLRDILNAARTCKAMHDIALYLIDKNMHQIISRFIPSQQHHHQFFSILNAARGVIVGSCALNMILGTPSYPTKNLNIVVPKGELDAMEEFLTDRLFFKFVSGTSTMHRIMETTVKTFCKYTHRGVSITLSEAKDKDVMQVILKSATTADMSFMTPGGAVTFYPEMTFDFVSCLTDTAKKMTENEKFGNMCHCRFHLEASTQFLERSCGSSCPALWRQSKNTNEYFAMNWDVRYNVRALLNDDNIEWRLGRICENPACDFRTDITSLNRPIPPNPTPATPADVADQMSIIANHKPAYRHIFKGILFPTNSLRPLVVDIPLKDGISQFRGLGDLEVNYWVNQRDRGPYMACHKRYRKTCQSIPNSKTALDHTYTFFIECRKSWPSPNALLHQINTRKGRYDQQNGNVLFVKATKGDMRQLVDMRNEDISLTTYLLKSVMEDAEKHTVQHA
ncbi:hypothetical protein P692DRAFT_20368446 [Suillus brevipes Sb2]|nr:hypothetical protein P692DRAFT_20368446 [Suillus brevipes Sb2]